MNNTRHPLPRLPGLHLHTARTAPTRGINARRNTSPKGRIRPRRRIRRQTMLHRIEMHVVHMRRIIGRIAHRVLPIPCLPNPPLAPPRHHRSAPRTFRHRPRKPRLDHMPSRRIIRVTLRQCPNAMQMVRQHHPRINMKRMPRPRGAHRFPQRRNLPHQQTRPPMPQRHREEIRPPRAHDCVDTQASSDSFETELVTKACNVLPTTCWQEAKDLDDDAARNTTSPHDHPAPSACMAT